MKPNNPVSRIMTTNLTTVFPETNMDTIHGIFEKNDFHHIPVLEKGSRLVGIISKEDYLRYKYLLAISKIHFKWADKTARDIMTEYPMCVAPDDSIGLAADIFISNKFHALPVLDDNELVGIITSHDLMAYAFKSPVANDPNVKLVGS